MSMWKKIVDLFVETEEEIIEETPAPLEKPVLKPRQEPVLSSVTKEPETKPETETVLPKEEKKRLFIDDVPPVKKTAIASTVDVKPEDNYEFNPIISPMFGVDERTQVTRVAPVVKRSPIHNSSALGTVISPIYGLNMNDQPNIIVTDNISDDEITNIPLSDLLESNPASPADLLETTEETTALFHDDEPDTALEIPFSDSLSRVREEATTLVSEAEPVIEEPFIEPTVCATGEEAEASKQSIDSSIDAEDKNAEIKRIMKELSEEDLFERENQPNLFNL